ncbi:TPA: orotate phosphoribosyltransferase [bacterium]|nr:orotate phosphoribosyltransferase [bacterium]
MSFMDILEMLKEKGAVLEGHFLLSSGLHSKTYIQMAKILQWPEDVSFLGERLARLFLGKNIDVVLSPAIGGITIGYETARYIKKRAIFAERRDGKMGLFRNFEIKAGECVLIVEDVFTTGGTVNEMVEIVEECGGNVVGIGVLVDRSKEKRDDVSSLVKIDIEVWKGEECPLCKESIPIIKPGSR